MFAFSAVTSAWSSDRSRVSPVESLLLVRASRSVLSGERMGYVTSCRTFKIKFSFPAWARFRVLKHLTAFGAAVKRGGGQTPLPAHFAFQSVPSSVPWRCWRLQTSRTGFPTWVPGLGSRPGFPRGSCASGCRQEQEARPGVCRRDDGQASP